MNNELYQNFKKSLEQKYNAICFDIDGTLTVKNSNSIDKKAIDMIIKLLKKKISVVFITGRGETGLNNFREDIYDEIIKEDDITENDIKRMYVLTNDGARLFFSKGISYKDFLSQNKYITTEDELKQLELLNNLIKKSDNPAFDISYSFDMKTNTIINIRLIFNIDNDIIIEKYYNQILNIINSKFPSVKLSRGYFKGNAVIQIGTTTKDIAIERTEKLIGVPRDSMIRIGDCGDIYGNDFNMLDCKQGYSVDKVSGKIDKCFPIFDEYGNILKGVGATLKLIEIAKILPTVCLESAEKINYKVNFANAEKNIVFGRKKLLNKYNELININFCENDGIVSLFDKDSGSVIVPMYEWELMPSNSLKDFWATKDNENFKYVMRDNNNYLLRGSSTYYYFISNRISKNGKDFTTKENVLFWYNNYIEFLNRAIDAIYNVNNLNSLIDKKLLLGILDNCRNVLLIIMNHKLISEYKNNSVLLNLTDKNSKNFNDIYNSLFSIEETMKNMCFKNNYIIDKDYICELINKINKILLNEYLNEKRNNDKGDYSKEYRTYREIDNFAENYISVSLYNDKCKNKEIVNACGLSYGGIELPIIAKILKKNRIDNALILKFNKEVSGYSNKQLIDLRNFNINNYGGLLNSNLFNNSNMDIFDDNVLTGKTLQLAINALYDCNINVDNICIVRYPGINRIDQMFLNNTSAIDFNLFFNYIYGLCFNSPYSWKDNEWYNNDIVNYTDSLGVFDLNRKKIMECLIKNHDYKDESEVGEYKRRLFK